MLFLTVPLNFQYQNEKRRTANQRSCSMKFSMYKRSSLVEQRFSFYHRNLSGTVKKTTLYDCLPAHIFLRCKEQTMNVHQILFIGKRPPMTVTDWYSAICETLMVNMSAKFLKSEVLYDKRYFFSFSNIWGSVQRSWIQNLAIDIIRYINLRQVYQH